MDKPVADSALQRAAETGRVMQRRRQSRIAYVASMARAYPQLGIGLTILVFLIVSALAAPLIAPYDPNALNTQALLETPSRTHLFGTDNVGRDVFSRVVYGGRVSLPVVAVAVLAGMVIGVTVGLVSGYYRGRIDSVIMRVMDGFMAFPSLVLALTIAFALGASLRSVIVALAIVRIPAAARLIRGQALVLHHQDYVLAAHATGVGPLRIISHYFLPNLVSVILIQASLGAGATIFAEASLGFLGLGVPPPTPSWGGMLRDGYLYMEVNPWLSMIPGAMIFLAILSFNLSGDGLRDALDPRQRQRVPRRREA